MMIDPLDAKYLWERLLERLTSTERTIVGVLGNQPVRIRDIAQLTKLPAPNVSVYLGRMVDKRLIDVRIAGRRTVYQLCPELIRIRDAIEAIQKN